MFRDINYTALFLLLSCVVSAQGLSDFDALLRQSFNRQDSIELKILKAEKRAAEKNNGLQFSSSAGRNEFGDLDNGNIFRVKAGLEWDLLKGGLLDNKQKAKEIDLEYKIRTLELKSKGQRENLSYLKDLLTYSFNLEKIKFLNEREYLISILISRYEDLYHSHSTQYKLILRLYEELESLQLKRLTLEKFNLFFERMYGLPSRPFAALYLPILELNAEALLNQIENDSTSQVINELMQQKSEIQKKRQNSSRVSLYNHVFWRPLETPQSERYLFSSVGVRFMTPLNKSRKEKKMLIDLQRQYDNEKREEKDYFVEKQVLNYVLQYNNILQNYIGNIFDLQRFDEERRLEVAIKLVDQTTPSSDLDQLDIDLERIKSEYKLFEVKERLYLILADICEAGKLNSILPFVQEKQFRKKAKKFRGNRILNLSETVLSGEEYEFIIQYLLKNEIASVIVDDSTTLDFSRKMQQSGIRLISKEDLLYIGDFENIPIDQFKTRIDMENWVNDHCKINEHKNFIINDLQSMLTIDSSTID